MIAKSKTYEKIVTISFYTLRIPLSGGKAGKGKARTSNVQVLNTISSTLERNFVFTINDHTSLNEAILKAKNYCNARIN